MRGNYIFGLSGVSLGGIRPGGIPKFDGKSDTYFSELAADFSRLRGSMWLLRHT